MKDPFHDPVRFEELVQFIERDMRMSHENNSLPRNGRSCGLHFCATDPGIAGVKRLLLPFLLATMACLWAAPIPPEETKNHIGEDASVRGPFMEKLFAPLTIILSAILLAK